MAERADVLLLLYLFILGLYVFNYEKQRFTTSNRINETCSDGESFERDDL